MSLATRQLVPAALALSLVVSVGLWAASFLPADGNIWWTITLEVQTAQRALQRELSGTLQRVKESGSAAAWWMVALSFLYGVLHAAGPGHGKIVISTYLLTQPSHLARGIWLSLVTSLFQGVTAVTAVGVVVIVLGRSLRQANTTANDLELLSYALVALAGLALTLANVRRIAKRALSQTMAREKHSEEPQQISYSAKSDTCCGCHHGLSHDQLDTPMSWRSVAGMAIAVGIRPCSGAILMLLFAWSLQLPWIGIVAVLAMSLGTAITVSILATLSVFARTQAERLAARLPGPRARLALAIDFVGLAGGLIILAAGGLLFQATWSLPVHPLK